MICYERVVDLDLRRFMVDTDGSTQAMADNAGCTRVRSYSMAITKLVRIGNTLCRQHQQQQCKTRVATQPGVSEFHSLKFITGLAVAFNRIVGSVIKWRTQPRLTS